MSALRWVMIILASEFSPGTCISRAAMGSTSKISVNLDIIHRFLFVSTSIMGFVISEAWPRRLILLFEPNRHVSVLFIFC